MSGVLLNLLAATSGGQVTRAEAFLRRFRHFSHPGVRLVVLKNSRSLPFCEGSGDWKVINVDIGEGRFKALRRMAWENMFLPALMRKERLDTYLTFSHYLPIGLGSSVHKIVGVSNLAPFSIEAQNAERSAVRLKMRLLRISILASARRADVVIALSNACAQVLAKRDVDRSKITIIPNGVELPPQSAPEDGSGGGLLRNLNLSLPYILSVSHFHRYKNYERLLEAYGLLPPDLRQKYSLVIVGKPADAQYFREIESLAARLDSKSNVVIIPGLNRSQLNFLYSRAALFVFPSLIENSPNILLEAMAHGLPVLASNIAPMPEFGEDAIGYFDGLSAKSMSERMRELLTDEDMASESGRRAKDRSQLYSWDTFFTRVIDLCNHAVANG